MNRSEYFGLIEKLVMAHAPSGNEREIDEVLQGELARRSLKAEQDAAGNLIVLRRGESSKRAIGVTAHKDEIGMIVKRIEEDGKLRITNIGGSRPWVYGEGVVDVLGDREVVSGILSAGSRHVSAESAEVFAAKNTHALDWTMVWIETKLDPEELDARGVHIGTKAVIGRHRKRPFQLGEYLCGYGLDCKVGVAILLNVLDGLKTAKLPHDVYFLFTAAEETGVQGAVWGAHQLPIETLIALEVGPVAPEYQIENTEIPVLLYRDSGAVYSEQVNGDLTALAKGLGFGVQPACLTSFGSDASFTAKYGHMPRVACLCYPTENTHGYEICSWAGIKNTARLLTEYLTRRTEWGMGNGE